MKKSEVLKIIQKGIELENPNLIIKLLEDAGVITPTYLVEDKDGLSIIKYGWEPEK